MTLALFAVFIIALLLGIPITFALGIASLTAILTSDLSLMTIPQRMVPAVSDHFSLIAIPLFTLAGSIICRGGMGDRLVAVANVLVGRTRGGLSSAAILASMFFGSISGSATASTSVVGTVLIPAMEKQGYEKSFSTAIAVVSSPLGTIIPPSIIMIVYAWITDTSIAALFAAGYIPGILIGVCLMIAGWIISVKRNYPVAPQHSVKERIRIGIEAIPCLIMPFIIVVGMFSGKFTATEAAAVAVFYGFIVSMFYYKELKWSDIPLVLNDTAKLTGIVVFIISLAAIFGWLIAFDRVPYKVITAMTTLDPGIWIFTLLYIVLLLILGTFLTPTEGIIIVTPILYPVALIMGFDSLHFGLITLTTLALGNVTPPVGLCIFVGSSISGLSVGQITRAMVPFYLASLIAILLIAFIPQISLFLPKLLGLY